MLLKTFLLALLTPLLSHAIFYESPNLNTIEDTNSIKLIKQSKGIALKVRKRNLRLITIENKLYFRIKYVHIRNINLGLDDSSQEFLCSNELHRNQPRVGGCTGFLVGKKLLATAGHCHYDTECHLYSWIFNYNQSTKRDDENLYFPKEDVYNCEAPVFHDLDFRVLSDIAVFRLSRDVKQPYIFKMDLNYKPIPNDRVYVLSHPLGMPLMASTKGKVNFQETNMYMRVKVDMFPGSSGAPLLNYKNGKVIGVLVRGEEDFIRNDKKACFKHRVCLEKDDCQGGDFSSLNILKNVDLNSM